MARLRNFWQRLTSWLTGWWAKVKTPLIVVLLIVVLVALYLLVEDGYAYPWTGFGPYTPPQPPIEGYQREKTTWDWLQLLFIPIVLAIAGFFLNRTERINAEKAAEQRAKTERELAEQRAQDAALQAYLDQMTQLLLHEKLRTSQKDDEVRSVARARTLTVLRVLDGVRKATVLQFLYEARLIGGIKQEESGVPERIVAIVSLEGADLRGVDLEGADLGGVYLARVDLREAYLERAHLERAHLKGAYLDGAHLERAHLDGAHLERAHLDGTDLKGAYLTKADLSGAVLRGAYLSYAIVGDPYGLASVFSVNLEGANLKGADLREAELDGARLHGADLTHCLVTSEQLARTIGHEGDIARQRQRSKSARLKEQVTDLREATTPDGSKHE